MNYDVRHAIPVDASAVARVHVDGWKTAYRGIIADDYLDSLSYADREAKWSKTIADPTNFVFVAEDKRIEIPGKTVIGFCSGGANRLEDRTFTGELYAIYILGGYHGKGVGKKLVHSLAESLLYHNFDSMMVWVLAKNPHRQFYERLGGKFVLSREIQIGGTNFEEVAYGWKDISDLCR
ncbi:MAG: GNAT family N-acetyltransferase [Nitrososphaerota archaeon]|nr:GNAT family N-acetyltransferase [Nitrososphaerota archaeon]MDG6923053.1 GNAT family N-acetyltransferase [Nitrososphaerota archaeon]